MKVKFKKYKLLNGQMKVLPEKVGEGILRRFDKTPFPEGLHDVVCPHFMLLAWANGCPYNCAWCFLKGTFRFYGQHENGRVPQKFKERERIAKHLEAFVADKSLKGEIINTGELCDSLMDEGGRGGQEAFSEFIMKYFVGTQHKVLFLTKSTNVKKFLEHDWTKNAILGWSINAEKVSERWEMYAPKISQRLAAARDVADMGYEVRLRIDPMVPIDGWQQEYTKLVDDIFKLFTPSVITLGTLRGLTTTIVYAKDKSWTKFLKEKSNWGKKPEFNLRALMYKTVIDKMHSYGFYNYGICKDTIEMWQALGLDGNKIKCNCVGV